MDYLDNAAREAEALREDAEALRLGAGQHARLGCGMR